MNLKELIRPDLWDAVGDTYSAGNYKSANVEALIHLFDVIRDKTGLTLDGKELADRAYGGSEPIIRVADMATQSGKRKQKGFLELHTGLAGYVRNDRAHRALTDNQVDAVGIICFVNYLLGEIDSAKVKFGVDDAVDQVSDSKFPGTSQFVYLMLGKLPKAKYPELILRLLEPMSWGDLQGYIQTLQITYSELDQKDQKSIQETCSELLLRNGEQSLLMRICYMLPPDHWAELDEMARLRVEEFMLDDLANAHVYSGDEPPSNGDLAACIARIWEHFHNKHRVASIVEERFNHLYNVDGYGSGPWLAFCFKVFGELLPQIYEAPPFSIQRIVTDELRGNHQAVFELVGRWREQHYIPWIQPFDELYGAIKRRNKVSE